MPGKNHSLHVLPEFDLEDKCQVDEMEIYSEKYKDIRSAGAAVFTIRLVDAQE